MGLFSMIHKCTKATIVFPVNAKGASGVGIVKIFIFFSNSAFIFFPLCKTEFVIPHKLWLYSNFVLA